MSCTDNKDDGKSAGFLFAWDGSVPKWYQQVVTMSSCTVGQYNAELVRFRISPLVWILAGVGALVLVLLFALFFRPQGGLA